jgi:hypothetical protein
MKNISIGNGSDAMGILVQILREIPLLADIALISLLMAMVVQTIQTVISSIIATVLI